MSIPHIHVHFLSSSIVLLHLPCRHRLPSLFIECRRRRRRRMVIVLVPDDHSDVDHGLLPPFRHQLSFVHAVNTTKSCKKVSLVRSRVHCSRLSDIKRRDEKRTERDWGGGGPPSPPSLEVSRLSLPTSHLATFHLSTFWTMNLSFLQRIGQRRNPRANAPRY